VSVVCCHLEVSATGRSLVQTSPTECGMSECDREASIMKRPWPTRGCGAMGREEMGRGKKLLIGNASHAFLSNVHRA
jgi:hypothetical protein